MNKKLKNETDFKVTADNYEKLKTKGKLDSKITDDDTVELITTEGEDDEEKDTSEIDSLYSGSDDRAIEYGVQNENFEKLLESLKRGGSKVVKLSESVNPRIKVKDLKNYYKNVKK